MTPLFKIIWFLRYQGVVLGDGSKFGSRGDVDANVEAERGGGVK